MRRKGRIIKVNWEKGYGFISEPNSRDNAFFHHSGLFGIKIEALNEGDEVEFEIVAAEKGPMAVNIILVN
jgi:CspA family cold shock protein